MTKYFITVSAGLSGTESYCVEECSSLDDAQEFAYELACEHYGSYSFYYHDDSDLDEEEQNDNMQSRISYSAVIYDPVLHDRFL